MSRRSRDSRRAALQLGVRAESLACLYLRAKGYRILARRYTVKGGEVDIVARRASTIAFVEVKARATPALALAAIDAGKHHRLTIAARHWLTGRDWAMSCNLRGDALCISPWHWPRHHQAAIPLRI